MTNKKMIVSFADNVGHYLKALRRQELSLKEVGFGGEFEIFKGINDYSHIGSPFHKGAPDAVPYAFKAYSIKKAIEEGARYIIWMDSPVYATKRIDAVWEQIQRDGYLFFDNVGYSIGDYTSDACLAKFGMTREEAFNSPMLMACIMGFDVTNQQTQKFLDAYIAAASDGVSYPGSWTNSNAEVSNDPRVMGHRHDQSVASILVKQMGLKITHAQSTHFAYAEHKGKIPIADSVCLWSAGI